MVDASRALHEKTKVCQNYLGRAENKTARDLNVCLGSVCSRDHVLVSFARFLELVDHTSGLRVLFYDAIVLETKEGGTNMITKICYAGLVPALFSCKA